MIQVICVGLGRRGRQWVGWAKQAGANVVGIVDTDSTTLTHQGNALGIEPNQRFLSIDEAIRHTEAQAAIVCAPNHVHPLLAKVCLDAGLHLLIEKPLAEDLATAKKLVGLAERNQLQLCVAQQYRYEAPFQKMRQMIQDGLIGTPTVGHVAFYRWRPTQNIRLPILLNQAVHHFDVMRAIFGDTPIACTADLWDPPWNDCDGPTVVEATFRWKNGVRTHYSGSYVTKGQETSFNGLWRLEGSEGQITYDGNDTVSLTRGQPKHQSAFTGRIDRQASIVALCRDFLHAVRGGPPTPTSGTDHVSTLQMVFAVEKSARSRKEVAIDIDATNGGA